MVSAKKRQRLIRPNNKGFRLRWQCDLGICLGLNSQLFGSLEKVLATIQDIQAYKAGIEILVICVIAIENHHWNKSLNKRAMFHPFSIKVRHLARPHLLRHVPGSVDFFENMCLLQNIFLYDIISSFYRLENIGNSMEKTGFPQSTLDRSVLVGIQELVGAIHILKLVHHCASTPQRLMALLGWWLYPRKGDVRQTCQRFYPPVITHVFFDEFPNKIYLSG